MIHRLIKSPLNELQSEAFRIRKAHFGNELTFSIPGTVSYHDNAFPSQKERFAAISVTGTHCNLRCAHCKGKLLESMTAAEDPETLLQVLKRLHSNGALGVLVSGGANRNGEVPLEKFVPTIKAVKTEFPEFKVICHTGLIQRETAKGLKEAGVDQVLIDVIGDDDTIREVYHLNKRVEDYEETLWILKEMGHRLAPHIIIGHHFGEIRGEWKALEMVTRVGVETIVLVVIKPLLHSKNHLMEPHGQSPWSPVRRPCGATSRPHDGAFLHSQRPWSPAAGMRIPAPEEISKISAIARILNPAIPVRMGCIRPAHPWKGEMEKGCINSGVNTIAYPLQGTIEYAKEKGLETRFIEMCCSLI